FPNYGCSRLDLDRGIGHLRMFNVSHFVARSQIVKTAAATRTDLERETTIGPFDIYRLKDNANHYAIPLTLAPVLVRTPDWKAGAYRWFKRVGGGGAARRLKGGGPGRPAAVFGGGGRGARPRGVRGGRRRRARPAAKAA